MNVFGLLYSGARCDAKARGQLCAFAEHRAQRELWGRLANFGAVSLYWKEGCGDGLGACGDNGLMYRVTRG